MGIIELHSATPGMVLAKPVYSHLGMLLLKEGKELTGKDLLLLEAWGVKKVDIEGIAPSPPEEQVLSEMLTNEEIGRVAAEIEAKFVHMPQNDITMEIKETVRKVRIEELIEKKGSVKNG